MKWEWEWEWERELRMNVRMRMRMRTRVENENENESWERELRTRTRAENESREWSESENENENEKDIGNENGTAASTRNDKKKTKHRKKKTNESSGKITNMRKGEQPENSRPETVYVKEMKLTQCGHKTDPRRENRQGETILLGRRGRTRLDATAAETGIKLSKHIRYGCRNRDRRTKIEKTDKRDTKKKT